MLAKLIDFTRRESQILITPVTYFYMVLCTYLCMAWIDEGYMHADEHFQILEMAIYKNHVHLDGVPWEFVKEIRPTIQTWVVIFLFKILSLFVSAVPPLVIAFLTKLLAAGLSTLSSVVFYFSFKEELETSESKKWFFLFTAFNCVTFCNATHFSSEIISADFFILGLAALLYKRASIPYLRYLLTGFLFGLAFITRYQTGIMLFGLMAWLLIVQRVSFKDWLLIMSGLSVACGLGVLLDSIFYGHFVCTAWRYFYFNLVAGYSTNFGTSHWTYFQTLYGLPFGPLYLVGTLYFILKKPLHIITWIMLPFLLVHQLIGHKEVRFLLPLMDFIPFILLFDLQTLQKNPSNLYLRNSGQKWIQTFWYINTFAILIHTVTHYHLFDMYRYLWKNHQNQPITLYRYSPPDNPFMGFALPLEFYFPNNIHLKNYADMSSSAEKNTSLQWVLVACYQKPPFNENLKLIYDSCPTGKIAHFYSSYKIAQRSYLFRHRGRIYQL